MCEATSPVSLEANMTTSSEQRTLPAFAVKSSAVFFFQPSSFPPCFFSSFFSSLVLFLLFSLSSPLRILASSRSSSFDPGSKPAFAPVPKRAPWSLAIRAASLACNWVMDVGAGSGWGLAPASSMVASSALASDSSSESPAAARLFFDDVDASAARAERISGTVRWLEGSS